MIGVLALVCKVIFILKLYLLLEIGVKDTMSKVFVYGIDGGSFPLIKSFVELGELPNYKKLIENGAFGKFISTIPPHTAPGWTSISTGVYPGKHGIYQFWKTQGRDYIGEYQGAADWKKPPIWEVLNEYGLKTGVVNVPMTHPPSPLDGFMISWPLSKTLNYCYPENLLSEIIKMGGHFCPDIYIMYDGQEKYLESACEITRKRIRTIQYLMNNKEWDFFIMVFPEVDRICHFYWNYMDKESPYYIENSELKNAILKIYKEIDKAIGKIIDELPEDMLFVSLSDHGFRVGKVNFNINTFLIQKGYMSLREMDKNIEKNMQLNDFGYTDWLNVRHENRNYEVDWNKTKAYMAAPGSYGINFNLESRQRNGIVSETEKYDLFDELKSQLLQLKHPYKDIPILKDVVWGHEVYYGDEQKSAPDIMLIPSDYSVMVSHRLSIDEIFSEPEQKGMHCREGYILFYGHDVQEGKQLEECQIVDFFPTILEYFGIDIPSYVDGKIIDVFKPERLKVRRIKREKTQIKIPILDKGDNCTYSVSDRKEIEEKLKSLGYL